MSSACDPRQIAKSLLGAIDWLNEVCGYCQCPGKALHTTPTGKKDCRVNVDGAPTIHCFHASCAPAVAEANRRLRRALGAGHWEIRLPSGGVLRSGDVLERDGSVLPREVLAEDHRRAGDCAPYLRGPCQERVILETLRTNARRFRAQLLEFFRWPMARILEESPLLVAERDAEEQFRTWLKIWPPESTVWIGDVFSSGEPRHRTHFRPIADWYQIGPVMGNYTCGSSFKAGSYRRCNENLNGNRFMVVESDTLTRDEVGAIFAYLNRRLHFTLHAIIDTAGKSLHGWFDAPRGRLLEERLKATLVAFGCDPKVFTYSQPVRVPGAYRDGRLQRLVWLRQ